jgi:shikimate kinase
MTRDLLPKPTSPRGLALVGYRGTGKSTVGRILSERLSRRFVDADLEIEARAGRSASAIFASWGEPVFRDWEERTLAELTRSFPDAIIATGGGVVLREANRRRIREFGYVAWLTADASELARRLASDPRGLDERPALTPAGTIAEIAAVLAKRKPLYAGLADIQIETGDKAPEEVANAILACWRGGL